MSIFGNTDNMTTNKIGTVMNGTPVDVNMIGQGTVIEGTLRSKNDVRISGKVIGKVSVEGRAIVTADGTVEGEIHASQVEIAGTVKGDVVVKERLVLKDTAVYEGDVRTNKLVIEDGAQFTGKCDMSDTRKGNGQTAPPPVSHASNGNSTTGSNGIPNRPQPATPEKALK